MGDVTVILLAFGYAYLVGAVPTAYVVGRWRRGIDIRRYGSGNVGASNVAHHLGRRWFAAVAAFDLLVKGAGSVLVAGGLGLGPGYQVLAAVLASVGHNWSVYLGLSGGRALSVIIGALAVLSWELLLALLGVVLGGWLVFRSVALWFGIAIALLPAWAFVLGLPAELGWFAVAALGLTALKRVLSNPGTSPPGSRWRDKALPRLLYDRDTPRAGDWATRAPGEPGENDERE